MSKTDLCPFSKPIIGGWCQCEYASLSERCSGKMACTASAEYLPDCLRLVELFRSSSRFVLGIADTSQLTHSQLMKIRCGGLLGMQRHMDQSTDGAPSVTAMMELARQHYGELAEFPFSEILRDIQEFSHRKKLRK